MEDRRSRSSAPDSDVGEPRPDLLVVRDRRLADLLTNPRTLRQLEPFLGRRLSVTEAARETGEKPNTVLARVRRFVELGLLEVAGERRRRGRAVKLYRTPTDGFFVPFEVTSSESLEAAMAEREAYWERVLREGVVRGRREQVGVWGTRIYRDGRGRLQVQAAVTPERNFTALDPSAPAVLSAWRDRVYLDFEDAKALQRELFELLLRYGRKSGSQRYIVHVGMAPVAD